MQKTIITCDHCEKEVPDTYEGRFVAQFLSAASKTDDIHACSREHLGFALAKAFGIPIDGNLAPILAAKDARALCLENDLKLAQRRIAELEDALADSRAHESRASAAASDAERRVAELEKRLATPPVDATGKTPGDVLHEARKAEWKRRGSNLVATPERTQTMIEVDEHVAHAVLRAFGVVKVLRRVRERIEANGYLGRNADVLMHEHLAIINAELATLDASLTYPEKPTKPLADACPECKGSGESMPSYTCGKCGGDGLLR